MASQSFRNTIRIIEDALRSCPTLRKVVCTERPVRVDDMAELSLYSNSELRRLAVASEFASRIVVSSNMSELCTTEEEKVEVLRAPNSKGADGIHMRGVNGAEFFTETLIAAAKLASTSSRGLARGRQAASRLDGEQESRGTREPHPSSRLKRQADPRSDDEHETRMVRGPQPASAMESQQQGVQAATWAEVAANNHSSVLNSNQANQAVGLESQQNRTQPATWAQVASNNQSPINQSN